MWWKPTVLALVVFLEIRVAVAFGLHTRTAQTASREDIRTTKMFPLVIRLGYKELAILS